MTAERDYVLGTHDDELDRLGIQHRVWRSRALDTWMAAGFTTGQTLVDVGCGPGYASADLAEIVGRAGRIIAIDRSRRFLDALQARDFPNVDTVEADLDDDALPAVQADGAWVRWVFAFVKNPRALLAKIRSLLKPGGTLAIHEYFDYATWRLAPPSEVFEGFVAAVMESWRASGGEPDVGLQLPQWLAEEGFEIRRTQPIIDFTSPAEFRWQWPESFINVNLERLVELGRMSAARAQAVRDDLAARERNGGVLMITPAVVEIVAVTSPPARP